MNRPEMRSRISDKAEPWEMVVVGGGATGVGCAVDAASRGYRVLLLEQSDFGKGTSSRSTKLAHGGVRYLEQGKISLVMEALKERGILRRNAPHLVRSLGFIVPNYKWWEGPFYGSGLKLYNLLAGKYGFGPSQFLSRDETLARLPTIRTDGLRGGVIYYDGQFDDARLLINLVETAAELDATLLNYVQVTGFSRGSQGLVNGVVATDLESGEEFHARANTVINATGVFSDAVRRLASQDITPHISPSQGIHLVFDRSFLPADDAIIIPHTSDGRVMFAIPWHGHTLVGTTDTPVSEPSLEPMPMEEEIEFILTTAAKYLHPAPKRKDVLSAFAGIRPLVGAGNRKNTAAMSRDHTIHIDSSGLLTITGGKWTTYRLMAEECINRAMTLAGIAERPCKTTHINIHGYHDQPEKFGNLAIYGSDAPAINELIRADVSLAERLHRDLPYCGAEVIWATRHEMACTVEDVLARRTRALLLNARAAVETAPRVARLMAQELGRDRVWEAQQVTAFTQLAKGYLVC